MRTTANQAADRLQDWTSPGAALVYTSAIDRTPALVEFGQVHIVCIADSGMSALTCILFDRELPVSGREVRKSIIVAGLRALGV